jgi:glycosyltransferase involved in cell wall biosynthesis
VRTILFQRQTHTYLPEIPAYMRFLQKHYPHVRAYDSTEIGTYHPMEFDVIWRFMGMDIRGQGRFVVHEYNSLSTQPLGRAKNLVKTLGNARPQMRVFLNKMVRLGFGFADQVPYGFRDMGIATRFFEAQRAPEYDFVYAGSLYRGPEVLNILEYFAQRLKNATLLIVGTAHPDLVEKYKNAPNITFAGRVHYNEVAQWMAKGRIGLNLMPDIYPYNLQTATKVLEYCAVGLPIVSSRYRWMEQFVGKKDSAVFWLKPDFSNLTLEAVQDFPFVVPDVSNRRWDTVIGNSRIFDFIADL